MSNSDRYGSDSIRADGGETGARSVDGTDQSYKVVIHPEGGMEKEHAELMRKRLIGDGFHDHVVSVRPLDGDADE